MNLYSSLISNFTSLISLLRALCSKFNLTNHQLKEDVMKHLIIMFLVVGAIMMFFGCSQDNPVEPAANYSEQIPATLAKAKSSFTGTSMPTGNVLDPGTSKLLPNGRTLVKGEIAEWYDNATDLRVTGSSFWLVNKHLEADGTGKVGGSAEIIVDNEEYQGKWDISWHGYVSAEGVIGYAVGTGKEGDVKGLVAKWTYTMIFANGIYYESEGEIFEK
jgi:hypothetical protein